MNALLVAGILQFYILLSLYDFVLQRFFLYSFNQPHLLYMNKTYGNN